MTDWWWGRVELLPYVEIELNGLDFIDWGVVEKLIYTELDRVGPGREERGLKGGAGGGRRDLEEGRVDCITSREQKDMRKRSRLGCI